MSVGTEMYVYVCDAWGRDLEQYKHVLYHIVSDQFTSLTISNSPSSAATSICNALALAAGLEKVHSNINAVSSVTSNCFSVYSSTRTHPDSCALTLSSSLPWQHSALGLSQLVCPLHLLCLTWPWKRSRLPLAVFSTSPSLSPSRSASVMPSTLRHTPILGTLLGPQHLPKVLTSVAPPH